VNRRTFRGLGWRVDTTSGGLVRDEDPWRSGGPLRGFAGDVRARSPVSTTGMRWSLGADPPWFAEIGGKW